jgi:hypothetical protein
MLQHLSFPNCCTIFTELSQWFFPFANKASQWLRSYKESEAKIRASKSLASEKERITKDQTKILSQCVV